MIENIHKVSIGNVKQAKQDQSRSPVWLKILIGSKNCTLVYSFVSNISKYSLRWYSSPLPVDLIDFVEVVLRKDFALKVEKFFKNIDFWYRCWYKIYKFLVIKWENSL